MRDDVGMVGVAIGHATDERAITGCTAVLFDGGAAAAIDVRGGAAGVRSVEQLRGWHVVSRIDGVLFAGGSEFGLDAAGGVMRWLEERGRGFATPAGVVPIVPAAILYDLAIGDPRRRPDSAMGYAAADAARPGAPAQGSVGAGTGATIGKLGGIARATKAGIGWAVADGPGGLRVAALVACNALGDVIDASGRRLAGARVDASSPSLADSDALLLAAPLPPEGAFALAGNTTLALAISNAALGREALHRVAVAMQDGLARAISPVHTGFDGDVAIAASLGSVRAAVDQVALLARDAVAAAIVASVIQASSRGGVPALRDLGRSPGGVA